MWAIRTCNGDCERPTSRIMKAWTRPGWWPWPRLIVYSVAVAAVVVAGSLFGTGWYYGNVLKDQALVPDHKPHLLDLRVVAVGGDQVTLRAKGGSGNDEGWSWRGTYGLEWPGGYGQVGEIRSIDGLQVVRDFRPVHSTLAEGAMARIDSFTFPGDPVQAFGIGFEEVVVAGELGPLPAWFVPGRSDTWAIFVHGKDSNRREVLRILPTLQRLGFPVLVITYRNDEGVAPDPGGFHRYGLAEWRDLEAAVAYALDHGARRLLPIGFSMGGGIVASFLYESPLARQVSAVVLDSPMLDFGATIDMKAKASGLPGLVAGPVKWAAGLRYGIDWSRLDYIRRADQLGAPILLFHSESDAMVPVSVSDRLAKARPDLVTYRRTPDAGHVRSWNVDPAGYEAALADFLRPFAGD